MNEPVDLSQILTKTDVEMKRLGWTLEQGREFLIETYGKRGRTLLNEDELLDFLRYLEYLPTPESKLDNPIKNPITNKVISKNPSSSGKTTKKTTKTTTARKNKKTEPIDYSEVITKTDLEMERLGWNPRTGREYVIQTYGRRGRALLTEEELLDFLQHLESLPTPTDLLKTDPLAGF